MSQIARTARSHTPNFLPRLQPQNERQDGHSGLSESSSPLVVHTTHLSPKARTSKVPPSPSNLVKDIVDYPQLLSDELDLSRSQVLLDASCFRRARNVGGDRVVDIVIFAGNVQKASVSILPNTIGTWMTVHLFSSHASVCSARRRCGP